MATKSHPAAQLPSDTVRRFVLHPYQAKLIAAILSDKPVTICFGRQHGRRYAERIAKQIKAEMDDLQNPGVHPSPDASAGVGGATRCSGSE